MIKVKGFSWMSRDWHLIFILKELPTLKELSIIKMSEDCIYF